MKKKNRSQFTVDRSQVALSVVYATKNEEDNIGRSIDSVKEIADETIVFDEYSEDNTREIVKEKGAKVFKYQHKTNFHETKQKAIEKATGDWILQLDADEVVTPELAKEIVEVITSSKEELQYRMISHPEFISGSKSKIPKQVRNDYNKNTKLFVKYQSLIEQRDGQVGTTEGEVVAFFIPRKNVFLGKPITYGGVYPDAVIRLFKKGKAGLPAESVHELMEVDGRVGWLFHDLLHYDSPTFKRYFSRWNRYTDLIAKDLEKENLPLSYFHLAYYSTLKPLLTFMDLYIRHKGVLDGFRGFVWSLYSALRFPVSYFKYWQKAKSPTKLHHYLVYFEPPKEVSLKIEKLNKLIDEKYGNKYSSYMNGEWFSHIAVYFQSPMPRSNEEVILSGVEKVVQELKSFRVTLGSFIEGNNGYIFVDINDKSKKKFNEIFNKLKSEIKELEGVKISQKYLDKWYDLSDEEKERVEKTGRPYLYQPHISVVKLNDPDDTENVLELIKNESLEGYEFRADKIKVLDFHDGDNDLIAEFPLED